MAQTWESWEVLLNVEILIDSIMRESLVLGLVSLHLSNEIDKMLRFLKKLKLFSVNKIAKLVFNLDDQLDHVKGVQTVVSEVAVEGNACLLGGSEVVLENGEDVFLDLVVAFQNEGMFLFSFQIFPERNLIGGLVLSWHEVSGGVEAEMALEASRLESNEGSTVLAVDAAAEADVAGWLHHL